MIADIDAMPYDADLLNTVIAQHGVTVMALAARSGYDDKTIYRYLTGERTLPSNVLRAAFELTGDLRITGLVIGAVPVQIMPLRQCACAKCRSSFPSSSNDCGAGSPAPQRVYAAENVPPLDQAMRGTLEAIERAAASGKYMYQIVKDGKFTEGDLTAADKFEADAVAAQQRLGLAIAAIRAHRERVAR